LDLEIVKSICQEYRVNSADIRVNCDASAEQLIDEIEGNRYDSLVLYIVFFWVLNDSVYTPCLYVLNKIDQITIEELDILNKMPDVVPVSGFHKWNLDELLEKIWDKLDLIRMYVISRSCLIHSIRLICSYPKPRGAIPDYTDPVVLRRSACTMTDFCDHIHKGILKDFKW
jgi:ribosome-interacting GTPase 1